MMRQSQVLDSVFDTHRKELGKDFEAYRGHCYRVYHLCLHFGVEERDLPTLEIATAYHDLGIWVHQTMDYLEPSRILAETYSGPKADKMDAQLLGEIIQNHHKLTPYKSHRLVEVFRKADLIDVSQHWIRFGADRDFCRTLRDNFPFAGFHGRLRQLLTKQMLNHPLRPLPMMKF